MRALSAIALLLACARAQEHRLLRGTATMEDGAAREIDESSPPFFGTSLFSKLCAAHPSESVLLSPLSAYDVLSLVQDGATEGSDTESEMERMLGGEVMQDKVDTLQRRSRKTRNGVQLEMATSIWADRLKLSYVEDASQTRGADAFDMPETYTAVDDWIKSKSKGMLKDIMGDDDIDELTKALLINVIYFKGSWRDKFDPEDTYDGIFTLDDGSTAEARFMTARGQMQVVPQYDALGGADVLVLDYGKRSKRTQDPEFSAIFIKPASSPMNTGAREMNRVISGLESLPVPDLLSEAREMNVHLKLPRFRIEFGPASLKQPLQRMGMKAAFRQCSHSKRFARANKDCGKFERMSDDPLLYVDDVLHGACLEVTEEGTEAAAATVAVMKTRAARPRTLELIFDRPFLMIVVHRKTGLPLFIAKVSNPELIF